MLRLSLFLLFVCPIGQLLEASHFRGSSISYQLNSAQQLTVTVYAVWRSSFIGGVNVRIYADNDTNRTSNLLTMTQTSVQVTETGFEFPGGQAFTVRRHVFQADISGLAPGYYIARWRSGNRVTGIVNVGNTRWGMETRVNFNSPGAQNSSPNMVPATIDMVGIGLDWSQNLFAVDPDNSPLSFQFIIGATNPQYGVNFNIPGLTIDTIGQLFIPAASTSTLLHERRYAYKVRVTDGSGAYAERDVLVVARNPLGNNPPVLNPIGSKFVTAGSNLSFLVQATDVDSSDNLTLRMTSTPAGSMFPTVISQSPANSTFTWNQANPPGIYQVGFEVFDTKNPAGTILIDNEIVTMTVAGNNQFPVLNPIGNQFVPFPGTLTFTVSGSDLETTSANLVYTASFLPPGASFNATTRVFTWTPTVGQQGVWPGIVFRVTDDDTVTPLYDEETIAISVNANQSPNLNVILNQNINLPNSLSLVLTSTDPNGDIVSLSLQSAPSGANLISSSGTTASGNLSWTPSVVGTYAFTIRAQDNGTPILNQDRSFQVFVVQNTTPATPSLLSPISSVLTSDTSPTLSFTLQDSDGDAMRFHILIGTDAGLSSPVIDFTSNLLSSGNHQFTVGSSTAFGTYSIGQSLSVLASGNYYWKVRATDIYNATSSFSSSGNSSVAFIINSTPNAPQLLSPIVGAFVNSPPSFQFNLSDPDQENLRYQIQVSSDSGFTTNDIDVSSGFSALTSITTSPSSLSVGQYYWRVRAFDASGAVSNWSTANSGSVAFTIDSLPSDPSTLSVTTDHGQVSLALAPSFSFGLSDSDNEVSYRIVISTAGGTVIDFESALLSSGNHSFTVGQAASGGVYHTGMMGQTLAAGTYTWSVQAISSFGRQSNVVNGPSFIRNTAPIISNLIPNAASSYFRNNANTLFQFEIADAELDQIQYQVDIYQQSGNLVYSTGPSSFQSSGNFILQTTPLTEIGAYYWTVQTTDAHGSPSSIALATGPGFLILGQTPVTHIISPIISHTTEVGSTLYQFQIDDPENDAVRYEIQVSSFPSGNIVGTYVQNSFAPEGSFAISQANLNMSQRGDYNWKVQGFDVNGIITGAGNIAYSSSSSDFAYSINSKPTISSFSLTSSFQQSGNTFVSLNNPSLNWTLGDDGPEPLKYHLVIDNSSDFLTPVIDYTSPSFYDVYSSNTLSTNLIMHWKMDEIYTSTTPNYISDNFHLTHQGVTPVTGVSGKALYFDGSNTTSLASGPLDNLSQFTFGGWIHPSAPIQTGKLMGLAVQGGVIGLLFDVPFPANQARLQLFTINGGLIDVNYSFPAHQWVHIAGVGTGAQLKIYLNGSEATITAGSSTATSNYGVNAASLEMGGNSFSPGAAVHFEGMMDDWRLYDKALSSTEILALSQSIPASVSIPMSHTVAQSGNASGFMAGLPTTTLAGGEYFYKITGSDLFNQSSNVLSGSFIINTSPSNPNFLMPSLSQTTSSFQPYFSFQGKDVDGGPLSYIIRVAKDNYFANPVLVYQSSNLLSNFFNYQTGQAGGSYSTGSIGQVLGTGRYNWDVQLVDSYGFKSSQVKAATTTAFIVNQSPVIPTLSSPILSSIVRTTMPSFIFTTSDPDGDALVYTISVDDDLLLTSPEYVYNLSSTIGSQTHTFGLSQGNYLSGNSSSFLGSGNYFWEIKVEDHLGSSQSIIASTASSGFAFKVNELPLSPKLLSPVSGETLNTLIPEFQFELDDPESDPMQYIIEISSNASFSSLDIQYRSSILAKGTHTFVTTQSGTYLVGQAGSLNQGDYYWRIKADDLLDSNVVLSTANQGQIAFKIDSAAVLSGIAEINPQGALQGLVSEYTLDFSVITSSTSTGFNQIDLAIPSGFSVTPQTLQSFVLDGQNVTASLISQTLRLDLPTIVSTSRSLQFKFPLQNPSSAQVGNFLVTLRHTSHSEDFQVSSGDANSLGDGGSLSVQIQSSGAALSALSEILPQQTTQAAITSMKLYIDSKLDVTSSGIDIVSLSMGSGYQLLSTGILKQSGNIISYTSSGTSSSQVLIELPSQVKQSSFFELNFEVRAPLTSGVVSFQGYVQTKSSLGTTSLVSGDGDRKGDGGSLTTKVVSLGPAISAVAEVEPDVLIKGSTNASFELWIDSLQSPSTSGVEQIDITFPSELTSFNLQNLRFEGSSISYTSSVSGQTMSVFFTTAINLSGRYQFEMETATAATIGRSKVGPIVLKNNTHSETKEATEGDGKRQGDGGTLFITRIANGAVRFAEGEIFPRTLIKSDHNLVHLYANIQVSHQNHGFNRLRFFVPSHINHASIQNIQWNGTSIQYSSETQTIVTDESDHDHSSHHANAETAHIFYVSFPKLYMESGVVAIQMDLEAKNEETIDQIEDFYIAYTTDTGIKYSTSSASERVVIDGDGDAQNNGGQLEFEIRSVGPAADAFAEILPKTFTKGKEHEFKYYIYPLMDSRHSGVNVLEVNLGSYISNTVLNKVKIGGSTVLPISTSSSGALHRLIIPRLEYSSPIELNFKGTFHSEQGYFPVSAAKIDYTTFNNVNQTFDYLPIVATTGDGDANLDGGQLHFETRPAGPALEVFAEIKPNLAIKSSRQTFSYFFNLRFDTSSSGVDSFVIQLPSTFSSALVKNVKKNGQSISYLDQNSTSTSLKVKLTDRIQTNSILEIEFEALSPSTEIVERLAFAYVDDQNFTFPLMIKEGDGDGKLDGGSLNVKTLSKAVALSAVSEILPNQVIKSSAALLTYHTSLQMDQQTSGVNAFDFQLPFNYSSFVLKQLTRDGASIAYTSQYSSSILSVSLTETITESSVLSFMFEAVVPSIEGKEIFPGLTLKNTTSNLQMLSVEGDGNGNGVSSTLTVETVPAGPAASALAEIKPTQVIKASQGVAYTYYIQPNFDASSAGIKSANLTIPLGFENFSIQNVRHKGSSIAFTTQVQGSLLDASWFRLIQDGWIEIDLLGNSPSTVTREAFQPCILTGPNGKRVFAKEGFALATLSEPHQWSVDVLSAGAGRSIEAEVLPHSAFLNQETEFTLYAYVIQDNSTSPVKRLTMPIPLSFQNFSFERVQINGSSVVATHGISTSQLEIILQNEVKRTSLISIVFKVNPVKLGHESFQGTQTWYQWGGAQDIKSDMQEGDGDQRGPQGSNSLSVLIKESSASTIALAEISPNQVASGSSTIFKYDVQIDSSRSKGVDVFEMDLPAGYTLQSILTVQWKGSSIAYQSLGNTTKIQVKLDTLIQDRGTLSIQFKALTPNIQRTDVFSLAKVVHQSSSEATRVEEGDGDGQGYRGSNSLSVTLIQSPPVAGALTEIYPNQVVKGHGVDLYWNIALDIDANSSGVESFELELPESFETPVLKDIQLSGQSIQFTTSISGHILYSTPVQKIDRDQIVSFIIQTTPLLGFGRDIFPLPKIKFQTQTMLATVGDTDSSSVSPENSLQVEQNFQGPVERVIAEVSPTQVATSTVLKNFSYHVFVRIGKVPTFTGFDTLKLNLPSTYSNPSLNSVKVDGSSVYFTDQSSGLSLQAKLNEALLSDAVVNREFVVTLYFSATTSSQIGEESFSDIEVFLSSNSNFISRGIEGDGDQGIETVSTQTWTVNHVSGLPAEDLQVEVYPNQFLVNAKGQSITVYAYADLEDGNRGITSIQMQIPQNYILRQKKLSVNGIQVGSDQSTSSLIKYVFQPNIQFDTLFKFELNVDIGPQAFEDRWSLIELRDSFGAKLEGREGDGDQGSESRFSNIWSVQTLEKSIASRIESNLGPRTITTDRSQTFNYLAYVQLQDGDQGFDTLQLGLPSQLNNIQYLGTYVRQNPTGSIDLETPLASSYKISSETTQLNGTTLSKSSLVPSSTTGFNITLPNAISTSSIIELRFSGMVSNENDLPIEFSQFAVSLSSLPNVFQSAIQGDQNSWSLSAFVPRAIEQALAEITPNLVATSTSLQSFSLYMKTKASLASGFNRIKVSFPTTYSNYSFDNLLIYSSVSASGQSVGLQRVPVFNQNEMLLELSQALTDSLLELKFKARAPSFSSSERFSLVDFYLDGDNNPVQITEGDTGLQASSLRHSIRVLSESSSLTGLVLAELNINEVRTPVQDFLYSYQVSIEVAEGGSGVDSFQLVIPSELLATRLRGVRINDRLVLYEDQSYYTVSDYVEPAGGQAGGTVSIRLASAERSNFKLELFLSSNIRPNDKTITFSQFSTYLSSSSLSPKSAQEGDGGSGTLNSWSLRLLPPIPGIRSLSDYPLLMYHSGDYAMPSLIGFGNPGESVVVRDAFGNSRATTTVDATGFYVAELEVLDGGQHFLQADHRDLLGESVATSSLKVHRVIESSEIPVTDLDGDGSADYDDPDDDGDGLPDVFDPFPMDTDNDGFSNGIDSDDDNDGVSDVNEQILGTSPLLKDSNGDGVNDIFELKDSDGDGLFDSADPYILLSSRTSDLDGDGIPDFWDLDDDGDLILDKVDINPYDTDGDGLNHAVDLDDDNDGVSDEQEKLQNSLLLNPDSNGDGVKDVFSSIDSDLDGIIDVLDTVFKFGVSDDLDQDGISDKDDLDIDGDGIENIKDLYPYDYDNDGLNDMVDLDDDNDGLRDSSDVAPNSLSSLPVHRDSDNDGLPNFLDPDDDQDGKLDENEGSYSLDANQNQNRNGLMIEVYDLDRDGVKNQQEYIVGTDARNSDTNSDGFRDRGLISPVQDRDGDGIDNDLDPLPDVASGDHNQDGKADQLSDYLILRGQGTTFATKSDHLDADLDGIANFWDAFPFDSDNDGLGHGRDVDLDNDGIIEAENDMDSDNDGVKNSDEVDRDNDGLLDILERVMGTNLHQNLEQNYLRPSSIEIDLNANPKRSKATDLSYDWSKITGEIGDSSVVSRYQSDSWILPVVPMWKVTPTSAKLDGYMGPLWGEIELVLNDVFTGKTAALTVPLTEELIKNKRKLVFKVQSLNEKQEWVDIDFQVEQIERRAVFYIGPHQKIRIYYQDFGFTLAPGENNAGGGCFLKF